MTVIHDPRTQTLSYREVVAKYPDVSPFIILKADAQLRGVTYSASAIAQADPILHLTQARSIFYSVGEAEAVRIPISLITGPRFEKYYRELQADGAGLSTVWLIDLEELVDDSLTARHAREKQGRLPLVHLDRIARA